MILTMLRHLNLLTSFFVVSLLLIACDHEDPGPLQEAHKEFVITDFDQLEIGGAFNVEVDQASSFSISVVGDRRNIDDLDVYTLGNTLIIEFEDNRDRHHDTYISITMPVLMAVNFSGAGNSKIRGFETQDDVNLYLSGASVSQVDADFDRINVVISGGSNLLLVGTANELRGDISGASLLRGFDFPVRHATIDISGASVGKLTVTDELNVTAGGASSVLYRGDPTVMANTSGASWVQKD
jgi:hypothetical protein